MASTISLLIELTRTCNEGCFGRAEEWAGKTDPREGIRAHSYGKKIKKN